MQIPPLSRIKAFTKGMVHGLPNWRTMQADVRLQEILSEIDAEVTGQEGIKQVLRLLDASKYRIQKYFFDHLHSEIAAKLLTLKIVNLCLGKYHLLARNSILLSKPYGLTVDPANNCNLACPGCVHSIRSREQQLFEWKSGMLSEEHYTALLRRYGPYAIQTTLCNYGEPILNPDTPKFIRRAKSYLMRTMLSTSMAVKRFDAEAYASSGLDFMTISIDGASQPVYERMRKKGDLDLVLRNLESLVEAKRKQGRRSPVLNWQFLAFEHNVHELETACELARSIGVDQFTIASPFDVSWDDPSIQPAPVQPVTRQFHTDSDERMVENWNPFPNDLPQTEIEFAFEARLFDQLTVHAPRLETRPAAHRTCQYLYKNIVMDANGRILPCCAAPKRDVDLVFSNLQSIDAEPFNAEKYQLARVSFAGQAAYDEAKAHSTVTGDPHCLKCDWYGDQATAHIDRKQVDRYLRAAGNRLFDEGSIQMLSSW